MSNELTKMGAAKVSVYECNGSTCIHKQDASEVELNFYQYAAQNLSGVNTPELLGVRGRDLYIEHVPNRVSLSELLASESTFEQLASIHHSPYRPNFPVKQHCWTSNATEFALSGLKLPEVSNAALRHIQSLSQPLFLNSNLISGDSNDGNWGTRQNGELVLFDWERFGYGSPAIDLAPLVPRLGSPADYTSIVEKYIRHSSILPGEILEKQLMIAKSWLVVEVTNLLVRRNKPESSIYINWYRENVPNWLNSIEKMF